MDIFLPFFFPYIFCIDQLYVHTKYFYVKCLRQCCAMFLTTRTQNYTYFCLYPTLEFPETASVTYYFKEIWYQQGNHLLLSKYFYIFITPRPFSHSLPYYHVNNNIIVLNNLSIGRART